LFLAFAIFSPVLGQAQEDPGWAQAVLVNDTPFALYLYVDNENNLGCGPVLPGGGLFCTTHVRPGTHMLIAKTADGSMSTSSDSIIFNRGVVITWSVSYSEKEGENRDN
ncbi:MAG: hypothetical protein PHD74_10100, partial [Candidatus Krumholzibacteria bacterium]|nr:hypothetical protein [Candidatus Krumholzibacteria bacterium]